MPWLGGQVADGVSCVLAPNPGAMTLDGTNTWVLDGGGDSCIVVDPGPLLPSHLSSLDRAVQGREVVAVLLTHGHYDHAEAARTFARSKAAPVLGSESRKEIAQVSATAGVVVETVATPGHTADSVCFLLTERGLLLTGDSVLGRGTSIVAYPDGRLADYLASLAVLSDTVARHGVMRLLPGHGPAIDDPTAVLDYYRAHRHDRLAAVAQSLADGVASVDGVVADVYRDVDRGLWPAASLSVRAQLEYLASSGDHRAGNALAAAGPPPIPGTLG